jgi:MYXO-CTERM domain-containing protein
MRAAFLAASLIPAIAAADAPAPPMKDAVVHGARHGKPGQTAFTSVSHLIYLNNCMPNGCDVLPGQDDSLTQHSSIPTGTSHLAAWGYGQTNWNTLVQCVKDMYAPFDVQITDQDPGASVNHFELMVGGNSNDIGVPGAGGVAPFIPCDGQLQDNVITFVFAAETSNLDYLCWAAAQETSHAFGLDHELNAMDPMTYLSPPVKKPGFQNNDANCGENTPRTCYCGGQTQNSFQYLMDTMGPAHLDPATLSITTPTDGQWVKPGFLVKADAMSQLSVKQAALTIDGANASSLNASPLVFHAPATLAGGDHTVAVNATDAAARNFGAQVTVHVTPTCDATNKCDKGLHCLGGYCLPGSDVAGGLGGDCTTNEDCITGSCGTDGMTHACTAACDGGTTCPSGYACVSAGTESVCWPSKASSGGCSTDGGGGGSPGLALLGLGALVTLVRRKR